MKFINNHKAKASDMESSVPFFATHKCSDVPIMVIRMGQDTEIYQDAVMCFSNFDGKISYCDYEWFKNNFIIVGPVNSITVE